MKQSAVHVQLIEIFSIKSAIFKTHRVYPLLWWKIILMQSRSNVKIYRTYDIFKNIIFFLHSCGWKRALRRTIRYHAKSILYHIELSYNAVAKHIVNTRSFRLMWPNYRRQSRIGQVHQRSYDMRRYYLFAEIIHLHTNRRYLHQRSLLFLFYDNAGLVRSWRAMRLFKKRGTKEEKTEEKWTLTLLGGVVKSWIPPRPLAYCINVSHALTFHRSSGVAVSSRRCPLPQRAVQCGYEFHQNFGPAT